MDMELNQVAECDLLYNITHLCLIHSEIPWVVKYNTRTRRITMAADIIQYWFIVCPLWSWVHAVALTELLTVSQRHTGPRFSLRGAAAFCLHTNGGNIPQHLSGCRAKRAPWKQLPSGPPSGRRDTACQDFQRGAAENSIRQQWLISLLQLPECPNLDLSFFSSNLLCPPPQLQLYQPIDDPSVGPAFFF